MPRNTAFSIRTAVSKILKVEDDWENVDVRSIDVDALISRFVNLSDLAPQSLAAYESRFKTGLQSYLAYLDNPASYQPKGRKQITREDKQGATPRRSARPRADRTEATPGPIAHEPTNSIRLVVYPFPVRSDVFAELKLPADLTIDEATRLSAFLRALAMSDSTGTE